MFNETSVHLIHKGLNSSNSEDHDNFLERLLLARKIK